MSVFGLLALERPLALLLAVPWLLFCGWFGRVQRRACREVWTRVDPRWQSTLTVFTPRSLGRHLAGLSALGLLAVVAAARPTVAGEAVARPIEGRVALMFDASASMYATDVPGAGDEPDRRFETARRIAQDLVADLDGYAFAVVTWSGEATLQLPMTADRASIDEALRVVEVHNIYRRSGSRFANALDRAVHFAVEGRDDLQVVMLSDGEQPSPENHDAPLAALTARGVAVHGVAIGSEEGQARRIFDFRDVVAGKEEKRVLREYRTHRVDGDLRAMARTTGGAFMVAGPGTAETLAAAIRERHAESATGTAAGRRELAPGLLAVFLVGFVVSAFATHRRPGPPAPAFDLARLGAPPAKRPARRPPLPAATLVLAALLASASTCRRDDPRHLAARENERGIAADGLDQHAAARVHFERSIAFGVMPEIPTFNLARSLTRGGAWSEAHDIYQRALELDPELAPAHYNDGWALFLWGEAERDPRGCDLERTVELWSAASDRFAAAASLYDGDGDRERARANLRAVATGIAELEGMIASPPPECMAPAGGGAGGEEADQDTSEDCDEPNEGQANDDQANEDQANEDQANDDQANEDQANEDGRDQQPSEPDDDPNGGNGGREPGEPPPADGGDGGTLSETERQQIAAALERIRGEAQGEGTYHRRSLAEQFPAESWQSPDPVVWW